MSQESPESPMLNLKTVPRKDQYFIALQPLPRDL